VGAGEEVDLWEGVLCPYELPWLVSAAALGRLFPGYAAVMVAKMVKMLRNIETASILTVFLLNERGG